MEKYDDVGFEAGCLPQDLKHWGMRAEHASVSWFMLMCGFAIALGVLSGLLLFALHLA